MKEDENKPNYNHLSATEVPIAEMYYWRAKEEPLEKLEELKEKLRPKTIGDFVFDYTNDTNRKTQHAAILVILYERKNE